jgi:hypothetical protein
MWLLGLLFRTLFIVVLIAVTWRVASPQNETIWSSYETPGDLVRLILGVVVCIFLIVNIFRLPKDVGWSSTWTHMGPVLVALAVLCAYVIW